jgi:hypothetical protein
VTAADLLAELEGRGAVLSVLPGGMLEWRGPRGVLTRADLDRMREHKAAVVELLTLRGLGTEDRPAEAATRSPWELVGTGGAEDDPEARRRCLEAAGAAGWPAVRLPHRRAETVAAGAEHWRRFTDNGWAEDVRAALRALDALSERRAVRRAA